MIGAGLADAVDVWALDLHAHAGGAARYLPLLDDHERTRAGQFLHADDRLRFLVGRAGLRLLLGRRLGMAPERIVFAKNDYGKPLLASRALHFNVSHAGDWVVLAVSATAPVGVDVEAWQTEGVQAELSASVLTPHEKAWIAKLAAGRGGEAFTRVWVCKEAYVKACGEGVSRNFAEICIDNPDGATPSILRDDNPGRGNVGCSLTRLDLPGHAACMAYLGARPTVRLFRDLNAG